MKPIHPPVLSQSKVVISRLLDCGPTEYPHRVYHFITNSPYGFPHPTLSQTLAHLTPPPPPHHSLTGTHHISPHLNHIPPPPPPPPPNLITVSVTSTTPLPQPSDYNHRLIAWMTSPLPPPPSQAHRLSHISHLFSSLPTSISPAWTTSPFPTQTLITAHRVTSHPPLPSPQSCAQLSPVPQPPPPPPPLDQFIRSLALTPLPLPQTQHTHTHTQTQTHN